MSTWRTTVRGERPECLPELINRVCDKLLCRLRTDRNNLCVPIENIAGEVKNLILAGKTELWAVQRWRRYSRHARAALP